MKTKHTLAALGVALLSMAGSGFAAEEAEDKWQFGITAPLWAPRIDGDVTVHGNTADVDVSFDELKDHLDASFALGLGARKGKFGLFTDAGYMKFSGSGSGALGAEASFDLKLLIADAGASYQIVKAGEEHPFVLDATLGLRYWYAETDVKLRGPGGAVLLHGGSSENLYDPVVGLRGSQYLGRKFHLDFSGDIGGFGISDQQSDLTWSASGMVSYDLTKWCTLSAGYKALALDVSRGAGNNEKGLDIVMHGFLAAATFTF